MVARPVPIFPSVEKVGSTRPPSPKADVTGQNSWNQGYPETMKDHSGTKPFNPGQGMAHGLRNTALQVRYKRIPSFHRQPSFPGLRCQVRLGGRVQPIFNDQRTVSETSYQPQWASTDETNASRRNGHRQNTATRQQLARAIHNCQRSLRATIFSST